MEIYIDEKTGIKRCRAGAAKPSWIVKSVSPRNDYTLDLTFISGERKIYDMTPQLNRYPFDALKDKKLFMQAKVVGPTVVWSDEIDIAPETLYDDSVGMNA